MSEFHSLNLLDSPNTWRENYNTDIQSIQQEFQTVIHSDGSVGMDSTLNMGGYKITELAAGVEPNEAVNYDQLIAQADKYIGTNEIVVHPSFTTTPGKKYDSLDAAITYLYGVSYGSSHYKVHLKTPINGKYTSNGDTLSLYKPNTFIQGDLYTQVDCAIGNYIIDGGGSNDGWISGLVLKFTDTSSTNVRLRNLNVRDSILIVNDTVDLELKEVKLLQCVIIVQSGNSIRLMDASSNIVNFCKLSTFLTEDTGVNIDNAVNSINSDLGAFFVY